MTDILTPAYFSGSLSRPINPTNPTPKSIPTAVRLTMSEPCRAAIRGLAKSERSTITPISARNKPVIRLDFLMIHCVRNVASVSPPPEIQV